MLKVFIVQVDVRCITLATGGYYYRDHLPSLGEKKQEEADNGKARRKSTESHQQSSVPVSRREQTDAPLIAKEVQTCESALTDKGIEKRKVRWAFSQKFT